MEIRNLRLVRFSCLFFLYANNLWVNTVRAYFLHKVFYIFCCCFPLFFYRQNHRAFKSSLGRNNALTLYTTAVYR